MAKKYTLSEASAFLGLSQSRLEDMIAEGRISVELLGEEASIDEETLMKIKVELDNIMGMGNIRQISLMEDKKFIVYISDYINSKISELVFRLEELHKDNKQSQDKNLGVISGKLEELRASMLSLAEMDLTREASERLEKIMASALDRILSSHGMKPGVESTAGKALSASDIKALSSSISSVLDEKLARQNEILEVLKTLEKNLAQREDRALKILEEIRDNKSYMEIRARLEALIANINDVIDKKLSVLLKDKAEINDITRKIDETQAGLQGGTPDLSVILGALRDMQEGQKKARKIMIDLNVNLQKSLVNKLDEIRGVLEVVPRHIEEIKKVMPVLQEIISAKFGEVAEINKALSNLKDSLSFQGQEALISTLGEIQESLKKVDIGSTPVIEEKFQELRLSIEQMFVKIVGRQQKALVDRIDKIKFPEVTLSNILDRLQTIENTFPELSDLLEERFGAIDEALNKVKELQEKIQIASASSGSPESIALLDSKLIRIQALLDAYAEKFDTNTFINAVQEAMDETLAGIREGQESFQKIMINLNVNNQKQVVDKLEQLDRLNELIPLKDNVDEIAEQMQTFEAMMADINQLVDERLQVLQEIQAGLGGLAGIAPQELTGEAQTQLLKKMDEIRAIIDIVRDRSSQESLLANIKNLIDQVSEDLKQSQEAAQKILVNLNVNSQKWILERLEDINNNFDAVKEVKEQFSILENLIPTISELMDLKLHSLNEIKAQIQRLEANKSLHDNLLRLQKFIENETKSLRQSLEASQKIIVNLGINNQKLVMEKLNAVGLSGKAIDDIARKNQEILSALIGQMEPGRNLVESIDSLLSVLSEMKNNVGNEGLLEKVEEMLHYNTESLKKSQETAVQILSSLNETNQNHILNRIDQLMGTLAELRSLIDAENIVSSVGDVIVEGNEILKSNQSAMMNLIMKDHKELMDELRRIQSLKSSITGAGSTGELIPVIEEMLNNSISNFKRDMDAAHKVLVNLNVNLQKQLVAKIQEILEEQDRHLEVKLDSESIVNTLDYLLEEKLGDLKESQESLLSLNLSSQKNIMEKLEKLSRVQRDESIPSGIDSLLPMIEKIFTDKLSEIVATHQKAQIALENLTRDSGNRIYQKLDGIIEEVKKSSSLKEVENYLPAIRGALEETFGFLNQLRADVEALKDNIKLQDPEFMGKKFEEIKRFLSSPGVSLDALPRLEQAIQQSIKEQREAMEKVGNRLEILYKAIKEIYDEKSESASIAKIQQLFAKKLEETRELERQLVQSFQEMQEVFNQGYGSGASEENIRVILQNLEETRVDQEKLSQRIEQLSGLIQGVSAASKGETTILPAQDLIALDQIRNENTRLRQMIEKLRRDNLDLNNQLKATPTKPLPADARKIEQLQAMMMEKDRLLEECYRDKVELRDQLEKERRDKYEIIQKYETEKKELIDSLALERIQREKDRAELELLRAESRKKKWW